MTILNYGLELRRFQLKVEIVTITTHHVLHEVGHFLRDDGKVLEGGADLVRLLHALDGGLAESVQRLREVLLAGHVVCKSKK